MVTWGWDGDCGGLPLSQLDTMATPIMAFCRNIASHLGEVSCAKVPRIESGIAGRASNVATVAGESWLNGNIIELPRTQQKINR